MDETIGTLGCIVIIVILAYFVGFLSGREAHRLKIGKSKENEEIKNEEIFKNDESNLSE